MLFKRNKKTKLDWAVGLDFGVTQVRGVFIRRKDAVMKLEAFDIQPFPATMGQAAGIPAAGAIVAQLCSELKAPERSAFTVINPMGAVVCHVELPPMPLPEARAALQLNSVNSLRYLHRDLSNHCLDLVAQPPANAQTPPAKNAKIQLLVGAAIRDDVRWYRNVMQAAKVRPVAMELSTLTVVNGLLATEPELCQKEAVLLLDLGAHTTSMNFLRHGQLLFTHAMNFGGQQITEYLAQQLGVELPVAELEKLKMSEPVQSLVQAAIIPLARELRSSIDFFDQQHECRIGRTLACGGGACSAKILEILGRETGISIEPWNSLQRIDTSQTRGDRAQLATIGPELAAAVGAALARLTEHQS